MSTNLSLRPSNPESLEPPYRTSSASTADDMHSANRPSEIDETPESAWADAINAREKVITALEDHATYLDDKAGASSNYQDRNQLYDLSSAITKYADRARQVNGPTFDLITTGENIESHHGMNHDDAWEFMGALSLALRKTKLDPLKQSATFDQSLLARIEDSVKTVERATYKILSAHQDMSNMDDTEIEQCVDPKREITMGYDEYCDAKYFYNQALIAEMREQKSSKRE